ncbi:MAG: GAF domain-containing protein [Deltaproteobacteria bacterium]|nr:GAF domain-containing protein [Deltaproteobacteria bacterium]NIS77949.1 GAF domain-containing protein [Deltaproteobacteria bacterium]
MNKHGSSSIEIVSRIVEVSNSNIQVENRLKFICDILSREFAVDCVCIYKLPAHSLYLEPWVSSTISVEDCLHQDFKVRLGEGVSGMAAWKRQPLFVEDLQNTPPGVSVVPSETRDFVSIYSVPVKDDVYLYGAMNFSSRKKRDFSAREKDIIRVASMEVAGAIRNSRLYRDARKRVSDLLTLNEISRAITSSFRLSDIVNYVTRTTTRIVEADGCSLRLYNHAKKSWELQAEEGFVQRGLAREPRQVGRKIATYILREKRPLLINSLEDSHYYRELKSKGVSSFLGVPIVSKGKPLGVILYYRFGEGETTFDHECLNLVQTISTLLANVLENVKMYKEAADLARENQFKVKRLQTLYDVARTLMSTIKTEKLLRVMLDSLTSPGGLNYSRAILFQISADGKLLVPKMAFGPVTKKDANELRKLYKKVEDAGAKSEQLGRLQEKFWKQVADYRIPLSWNDECVIAKAVCEGKAATSTEGCKRVLKFPDSFCSLHADSFVVVPMLVKGTVRGAVYVDNMFRERELTEEDIHLLTMFASEAGLSLENSELYENLEKALSALQSTQDRLIQSEKLAALGEMAAQLAHEIKNPLTVVGGFASRMLKKIRLEKVDIDPKSIVNYARVIVKEVNRLERILNETLYFSRVEKRPTFESVEMHSLIREVLALFREEFEENSIEVRTSFSGDVDTINVDPDQIRQVVWNIISNAELAMESGGILTVKTNRINDPFPGVEIVISDTGGGIPPEVTGNIFNPFFTTRPGGTGLGLPIVHTIVTRHGGLINLDNRVGEGVIFHVFLPAEPEKIVYEREKELMFRGGIDGFKDESDLR